MKKYKDPILGKTKFIIRLPIYAATIALMANLNAIVDMLQHPEIPYFDEEHLIVGGLTALVTILLFTLLETYLRYLNRVMLKVKTLEKFLSICASCKKIRIPATDPHHKESWQQIETYISKNTSTTFSHGICPECASLLYPEYTKETDSVDKIDSHV